MIEMLIVLVILGILLVLGLFTYSAVRQTAELTRDKAHLRAAFIAGAARVQRNDEDYALAAAQLDGTDVEGVPVVIVPVGPSQAGSVDLGGICGDDGDPANDHVVFPDNAIGICATANSIAIGRIMADGASHYVTIVDGSVDRSNF